jgi:thiamine biosynthesis lipoprotein
MLKIKNILIIIFILLIATACNNSQENNEPVKASHNGMGTITDFIVFGEQAEEGIEKAKEIMIDIEQKMSLSIDNSEVNKINSQAGIEKVEVSDDTFEVISRGLYFSELTEGSFDISIAPITELWNIGKDDQRVPSENEIKEKLSLVNYKNIVLNKEENSIFLKKEDMKIDLGGIAKGFAADKIISTFKGMGIENALVNVGGNIKVLGENPQKNRPWRVGLRHPREARGSHFTTTKLQDGDTVVTSGDYERFFINQDIRYHHIFDAKLGKPSRTDIIGVSIITDNSMDADGLSTSVFVLGSQKGQKIIEDLEGVEAIIVTKELKIIMTEGAKEYLENVKNQL